MPKLSKAIARATEGRESSIEQGCIRSSDVSQPALTHRQQSSISSSPSEYLSARSRSPNQQCIDGERLHGSRQLPRVVAQRYARVPKHLMMTYPNAHSVQRHGHPAYRWPNGTVRTAPPAPSEPAAVRRVKHKGKRATMPSHSVSDWHGDQPSTTAGGCTTRRLPTTTACCCKPSHSRVGESSGHQRTTRHMHFTPTLTKACVKVRSHCGEVPSNLCVSSQHKQWLRSMATSQHRNQQADGFYLHNGQLPPRRLRFGRAGAPTRSSSIALPIIPSPLMSTHSCADCAVANASCCCFSRVACASASALPCSAVVVACASSAAITRWVRATLVIPCT